MESAGNSGSAADPLQEQMDSSEQLARLVAGQDDQRFLLVFHSLVNLLDGFAARPGESGISHARSVLLRSAAHVFDRG